MDISEANNVPDAKDESSPQDTDILVRADEVDEPRPSILDPPHTAEAPDAGLAGAAPSGAGVDGNAEILPSASAAGTLKQPVRPILRREASAPPPPPPRQPPPPAPPNQLEEGHSPADSLSLGQLRNIVATFPKLEPIAYAYEDADTRSFAEELEEWFQYTEEDRDLVESSRTAFEISIAACRERNGQDLVETGEQWQKLPREERETYVEFLAQGIQEGDVNACLESLQGAAYLAMGVWYETTDETAQPPSEDMADFEPPNEKYRSTVAQLNAILDSAELLSDSGLLVQAIRVMWHICDQDRAWLGTSTTEQSTVNSERPESLKIQQLNAAMTTVYFVIEAGRHQVNRRNSQHIRDSIVHCGENILERLSRAIARLRWDEESSIPFSKLMLLLWKSSLLIFGGTPQLEQCKKAFGDKPETDNPDDNRLTTSPLDYHIFRQEITSKYPAYNPPAPLIPLETNNNSILPPLPHHDSRYMNHDNFQRSNIANGNNKSIFHQPVHIATPAPSPPPSPAGPGGKGGKKQNYQTNQNFPFLYPPLDSTSNDLGGKGKAGLQDKLVGKKWEGGDVPASIVEAGQLFASRMRVSRALRQLWEIREEFIKSERGWQDEPGEISDAAEDSPENSFIMDDSSDSSKLQNAEDYSSKPKPTSKTQAEPECEDGVVQERLALVETYFRDLLPHLQSVIIVLLKILLSNVSVLGSLNQSSNAPPFDDPTTGVMVDGQLPQSNLNLCRQLSDMANTQQAADDSPLQQPLKELNSIRTREITSKAITSYLLHLLKWLRLSHVLKFEYAVQLLIDSNYVPLALKYFALQDIDKAVDIRNDREDLDFFHLCHLLSGHPESPQASSASPRPGSSSSSDSAAPPPIARRRHSLPSSSNTSPPPSPGSPGSPQHRPEVDELGYPTTALPPQPLTSYAPRFFHTYISSLRLLQKLTKGHAHRALMLVQYKSSTILRKALKIPQPTLRLYTLKLFKTQVPYCGRKWRQANMRVITAIYVFCRMGLRDEWISGGGQVEEMVEGALGVETAWRGLVAWWLSRTYRSALIAAGDQKEATLAGRRIPSEDEDFFTRELERMGWGLASEALEDEEGEWDEWDEGPIQLDGW